MKDEAYIVNTSRPRLVDPKAIVDQLDRLGGFASDFPIPFSHPKVLITHHTGGYTIEDLRRTANFCFYKLQEALNADDEKREASGLTA